MESAKILRGDYEPLRFFGCIFWFLKLLHSHIQTIRSKYKQQENVQLQLKKICVPEVTADSQEIFNPKTKLKHSVKGLVIVSVSVIINIQF